MCGFSPSFLFLRGEQVIVLVHVCRPLMYCSREAKQAQRFKALLPPYHRSMLIIIIIAMHEDHDIDNKDPFEHPMILFFSHKGNGASCLLFPFTSVIFLIPNHLIYLRTHDS